MKFKAYSTEELNRIGCLPEGEYDFEIIRGKNSKSSAGNDMYVITIIIQSVDGEINTIDDYLLNTTKMAFKTKNFFESIGMEEEYKQEINIEDNDERLIFKKGKAYIGIRKDEDGKYRSKNVIKEYIKKSNENFSFISDDINF